jgi:polyisoprenoid-binding protein YceI
LHKCPQLQRFARRWPAPGSSIPFTRPSASRFPTSSARSRASRDAAARLVVAEGEATLEGTAKVESVDVKDENLAAHLQSPDFFDSERHPELRFTADDIDLDSETVTARGELTIKGVTRPVEVTGTLTAPIVDAYDRERIGLELSASVDRHEFGVSWNIPLPSGEPAVGDEVTIVTELYFIKAA